ncbi:hypothetical protein LV779_06505 [Streptomyces thinghirensis]|nr:hypothetical protein [Streptomyces thinghirensis]
MKPYDAFMDWAVGPDEESADEARAKKATKEFGKALVAWDMWQENPTRAAGTVIFNVLTLGAGPLAIASKASKGGVAGRTAGVAAKAGMFMDPVYIGLRATGTTVSAVPKLSELTSRIMGATGTAADAQRVHSVIELEDGSKVVIENGEFIPYDKHGDVVSDRPKQERSANAETMPEQTPVRERELAGVSAASRAPEASAGAGDRLPHQASHEASSGHGSGDTTRSTGPVSGRAGATHAGGAGTPAPGHDSASNSRGRTGSGATSSVGRDGRGPEPAAGAGGSETGSPHSSAHHHEARADTQEPHQGHDVLDAADGEGGTPSATHPHSGSAGDGGPAQGELLPGTARRTLREMRAMNHSRDRYRGAEDYVREMTGGAPERHYRVPSHDHPYYPVHGTGGRNVDVPVDMPDGRTLAVEVKHYLEWRTLKLSDGSTRPGRAKFP